MGLEQAKYPRIAERSPESSIDLLYDAIVLGADSQPTRGADVHSSITSFRGGSAWRRGA
jgi:hypothetical protein